MKKKRWGKKYIDKRDWHKYNEKLVRRGEAYVSLDFINSWSKDIKRLNKKKIGAPYHYPTSLIVFLAYTHLFLHIDYRGIEGFLQGLSKLVCFDVPDYSTICRRVNKIETSIQKTLMDYKEKDVVVSLDSTGVKVTNRGEWMREKWRVRRGWIKVHISVDDQGKQLVGIKVTNESVHDTDEFGDLMDQSVENVIATDGKIVQANADGAYDSNDNFIKLEEHKIQPGIKIRKPPPNVQSKNPRKKYAREFHRLGYKRWRRKYKYGKRWYVEGVFSAVKRKCGEHVHATKTENMFHEVEMKFVFYNALLKYDTTHEFPWVA